MNKYKMPLQGADEYLEHCYSIPKKIPVLPLEDEPFLNRWQESAGSNVLEFMKNSLGLPTPDFKWLKADSLSISFTQTAGGKLPVITTGCHEDFRAMEALVNGGSHPRELPLSVNAFTIQARAASIFHHRIILLNHAPYSNVPAEKLGLSSEEWLEHSYGLRLAHEGTHYETLRLLSGMKNHALDEICADAIGQIAAFGNFDADRQRLFFGLERGKNTCTGRLSFYCQKVDEKERCRIYTAVDKILDDVATEIQELLYNDTDPFFILMKLAARSIAERLKG
ncbi:hypothetical protein D081_1623 [Anaerovibrio sp. JC8]|uniref:DUF7005 family protein n=1 Tax=Anaerovibrio sp. JC8 TaxID=1240085 RepID=UPI000A09DDBE|nr:hypothetical protein [Anaerovibrio sp. JC8]ORT99739.1 hypothetical protein D081_1623 [Anaerovibrio sp. JC8]